LLWFGCFNFTHEITEAPARRCTLHRSRYEYMNFASLLVLGVEELVQSRERERERY